jgi:hypothetical protein
MTEILGYGEDALTLWALKHRMSEILGKLNDKTPPSDCIVFYRPSFGRSGGTDSSEFGEFDAILVSLENIYLIESKWDNLTASKSEKNIVRPVQGLRHQIFSWYITHWKEKHVQSWEGFVDEEGQDFKRKFNKPIASRGLLAQNLEFVLETLWEHSKKLLGEQNIKNVLVFFYKKRLAALPIKPEDFTLVAIDYSQDIIGNFVRI